MGDEIDVSGPMAQRAIGVMQWLERIAVKEIQSGELSHPDEDDLRSAVQELREMRGRFFKLIADQLSAGETHEDAFHVLWRYTTLVIRVTGGAGAYTESGKRGIKNEVLIDNAKMASGVNASKAADRLRKLHDAIREDVKAKKLTLATSIEFADRIRPGVLDRLGIKESTGWPSASTIKAAIASMK